MSFSSIGALQLPDECRKPGFTAETMIEVKSKKGIVLIVSFMIMATLIILSSAFLIIAVTEKAMANKDYHNKHAFWLAEAGIEQVRNEPEGNWESISVGPCNIFVMGPYNVLKNDDSLIEPYIVEAIDRDLYTVTVTNSDISAGRYTATIIGHYKYNNDSENIGWYEGMKFPDDLDGDGSFDKVTVTSITADGFEVEITRDKDATPDLKKFTYNSWGHIPSKAAANKKAQQGVRATVKFNKYNIGEFTFSTQGSLKVSGKAAIDGDVLSAGTIVVGSNAKITGEALDDSTFKATFENIFGKGKEELLKLASHTYTDPKTDQAGVDGFTVVNFSKRQAFYVTNPDWTGSGILIVNGGKLYMSNGTFNGIIWVKGTLRISGNAKVNGAIFVESGATVETDITGDSVLTYDKDQVESALGTIGASFPTEEIEDDEVVSWKEL